MTNIQPGWYADPSGSGQSRYWDGAQWTEHVVAPYDGSVATLKAPDGASPSTPWIWVLVFLPVLNTAITLVCALAGAYRMTETGGIPVPGPGYYVSLLVGLVFLAANAVVGYLDSRELRRRGVPAPFGWGWAFLGVVYIIGRSVVVHRRTGTGLLPLWIYIAVWVVCEIITVPITFSSSVAGLN